MSYRCVNKTKQYVEEVNFFSYFLFFHIWCFLSISVSFSFVNLQHAQVLLRVNGEYVESCCCCCFTSNSYILGRGEEEGCLGIPLYVIHIYNTISHLASFMQPNPPVLAFIIINYQNRMPSRIDKLARKKRFRVLRSCAFHLATIERLCMQISCECNNLNNNNPKNTWKWVAFTFSRVWAGSVARLGFGLMSHVAQSILALFVFVVVVASLCCTPSCLVRLPFLGYKSFSQADCGCDMLPVVVTQAAEISISKWLLS